MEEDNWLITPKGVLNIIFITVIFPDIKEITAYHTCKNKIDMIAETLALRNYGKSKKEINKEILNLKNTDEIRGYIDNIYNKYIYDYEIIDILHRK